MLVIENMWVYRLILCSVIDSFFEKVKASNLTTKNYMIFAKRKANTLLLISVKFNPGPTNIKYPCGECVRVVKFGPSIPSDQCDIWCHQECAGMNNTIFECYANATIEMQWACIRCGLPNISTLLLDSSISSINANLRLGMLRVKCKSLRIVAGKFQSIYNKKDELSSFLIENDVDIVLRSERHLSNAFFPNLHLL